MSVNRIDHKNLEFQSQKVTFDCGIKRTDFDLSTLSEFYSRLQTPSLLYFVEPERGTMVGVTRRSKRVTVQDPPSFDHDINPLSEFPLQGTQPPLFSLTSVCPAYRCINDSCLLDESEVSRRRTVNLPVNGNPTSKLCSNHSPSFFVETKKPNRIKLRPSLGIFSGHNPLTNDP